MTFTLTLFVISNLNQKLGEKTMKNLGVILIILSLLASACGGDSTKKETTKEVKKEKPLSKSTQEGMMKLLDECNIKIHNALEFTEVKHESNNYKIYFIANQVDETKSNELSTWFIGELEKLEGEGWKKKTMVDNEKMMGMLMNEVILLKPSGVKVNTSYGLTFSSTFDKDKETYKVVIVAD
jgi:hypothetical protein